LALLSLGLLLATAADRLQAQAAATTPQGSTDETALADRERAIDKEHLQKIHAAIQAYRQKHGELPGWLSDLFPDFLSDTNVLMSPVELRTGQSQLWGYGDPKAHSSYIYEFNQAEAGGQRSRDIKLTMKQWKTLQMEEYGPVIPILRCHLHEPLINLSYSGDIYETALFWETDTNTFALMAKLGPGPGAKDTKYLRLQVVDAASRQPVAGVQVLATNRQSEFGPLPTRTMATDAAGQCQVNLGGQQPVSLTLKVSAPGHAAEDKQWASGNIPEECAIELQKAVTIGGVVLDESGRPIAGAAVVVSGVTRDEVGQYVTVPFDTVSADQTGKWTSARVPAKLDQLSFRVTHPEFMPADYDQATPDNSTGKVVTKESLLAGNAQMTLEPGIRVEGTLADDRGVSIAAAEVTLLMGENLETRKQAKSDSQGRFKLVVFEAGKAHLVAQARTYAPQHIPVEAERGLKPLSLVLAKGNLLQGRVVDDIGKPVEGATVSLASWRNLPLLSWRAQTDSEGRFSWDSAPADSVGLSVSKAGFNDAYQDVSAAANEEATLRLAKAFQLTGKVADAQTKEPIKSFRLMSGFVYGGDDEDGVYWERQQRTSGTNGVYAAKLDYQRGQKVKFMALADGYLPKVTPALPDTGWHTFDFELNKGSGPQGVVVSTDGQPVAGAQVAILGLGYLYLGKAAFRNYNPSDAFQAKTDAQGRFSLSAALASPTLVAVHEQGFCEIKAEELAASGKITLLPWGRVEGVMKFGNRLATNEQIMLGPKSYGRNELNYDSDTFKRDTDDQGRFTFEYVPPGTRQLLLVIPAGPRSWSLSNPQRIEVKAGEVTRVTYGGMGRAVIGKVVLSDPSRQLDWNQGYHNLTTKWPKPPQQFNTPGEQRAWQNSPEMKAARENARQYRPRFAADGSFRVEDVPAGTYDLQLNFTEPGGDNLGMGRPVGSLTKEVVVPEMPGGRSDEPLDLGELKLQLPETAKP
jgi:protocatechuate 3,4-dioxygenase beta subunit